MWKVEIDNYSHLLLVETKISSFLAERNTVVCRDFVLNYGDYVDCVNVHVHMRYLTEEISLSDILFFSFFSHSARILLWLSLGELKMFKIFQLFHRTVGKLGGTEQVEVDIRVKLQKIDMKLFISRIRKHVDSLTDTEGYAWLGEYVKAEL